MSQTTVINEQTPIKGMRLGKAPSRSNLLMLTAGNFIDPKAKVPDVYEPWKKKATFPVRSFGNNQYGDCTRASQALLAMRMERVETNQTPKISDEEVIRVYFEMTKKYYGGGDTGAYEMDALNEWRREDSTFKDSKGRPLTIDAYTRVNHVNLLQVRQAIFLGQAKGIKACFNLPLAWSRVPGGPWDLPEGQAAIGQYAPGGWGGHSMAAVGYNLQGVILTSSWDYAEYLITWRAWAAYCDESYMVVDSINKWKKNKAINKFIDLSNLKSAVNKVSTVNI